MVQQGLHDSNLPKHIAIIMDGNGRWAKKRFRPRVFGHNKGANAIVETVKCCLRHPTIEALTLFAFSTENWNRPKAEVTELMRLFAQSLTTEVSKLHEQQVRFQTIGDLSPFDDNIQGLIADAVALTHDNKRLTMTIAINYGGKADIVDAVKQWARQSLVIDTIGGKDGLPALIERLTPEDIDRRISLHHLPRLDLLIRTGGEVRISNFLLWQAAYAELYFTEQCWPDFNESSLEQALIAYQSRDRRYGGLGAESGQSQAGHTQASGQ